MKGSAQSSSQPLAKRGRSKRAKMGLTPLVGRKQVRAIQDYLHKLRALYPHPNRVLFYDDVVVAYLLAFYNPVVRSLRCTEDMSQLEAVNRFLSVDVICKSTLSDANALFDPRHLHGLLAHVRSKLPRLKQQDPKLEQLLQQLICFDGSFFRIAGDVQWAMWHRKPNGPKGTGYVPTRKHLRLNCAFCQSVGVPIGVSISGDDGDGEGAAAMKLITTSAEQGGIGEQDIERIYLFDSGVVSFDLLTTLIDRGDHLVCNLRDQVGFTTEKQLPLTEQDKQAGIASDSLGRLSGSSCHKAPKGQFREIIIPYTDRNGKQKHMRLLTDILDLPAHLIAELYRHRWQVELFFRWLKVHAQFRHLMSFSRNGVTTGFYIATLAAMLLCLHSNQPLNKYAFSMFGFVANGLATPAEVLPILQKRAREKELEKARLARKRAEKISG